jgi:DNA polymerase II small subunit/DNA polymerase delta subunit B
MSSNQELSKIEAFAENLRKDPVKLKTFLRSVMGPPHVTLEGKDKEQALLLLGLVEPFSTTNNQHSWTEYYMIGETEYHVTIFPGEDPIVDKMLPEDDE